MLTLLNTRATSLSVIQIEYLNYSKTKTKLVLKTIVNIFYNLNKNVSYYTPELKRGLTCDYLLF